MKELDLLIFFARDFSLHLSTFFFWFGGEFCRVSASPVAQILPARVSHGLLLRTFSSQEGNAKEDVDIKMNI